MNKYLNTKLAEDDVPCSYGYTIDMCRGEPSSTSPAAVLLIQSPQFAELATSKLLENALVVWFGTQRFVELAHGAVAVPTLEPVEKVGSGFIAGVPLGTAVAALPVRC